MKRFLIISLLITFTLHVFSQKIIENPKHGLTTASNLKIKSIELSDTATVVTFHIDASPGTWIFIPGGSCLQPVGEEKRYYITGTEGIPFNDQYWIDSTGYREYKTFFPPIDPTTARLDFLEDNDGGSWFIYDIRLKEDEKAGPVNTDLQKIWFDASGSKQMVIAFYDSVAVYDGKLWEYGLVKNQGNSTSIELIDDQNNITLNFKSKGEHECQMKSSTKEVIDLCDWPKEVKGFKLPNDRPYSSPIFNNSMATYSGYIRDYTPRAGFKTGVAHVNNPIVGMQESYTIKIEPNGYFTVSIPMICPEEIYLDMRGTNRTVFLEPGKTTFQLIDGSSEFNGRLFQGETAFVNSGLYELKDIQYYNYYEANDTILKIEVNDYKTYLTNVYKKEKEALNRALSEKFISAKAFQVKEKNIEYNHWERLLSYEMNYRSALYKKNNNDKNAFNSTTETPHPDSSYYDFITDEIINDEAGMLANSYYFFTNRLKYNYTFTKVSSQSALNMQKLAEFIESKGEELTPEEKEAVTNEKKLQENAPNWDDFNKKYGDLQTQFLKTYSDTLNVLHANQDFALWYDIESVAKSMGNELSSDEKEMILAAQKLQTREDILERKRISSDLKMDEFFKKYRDYSTEYFLEQRENQLKNNLKEICGIEGGLAIDIMYAQNKLRKIVEELTPLTNEELVKATTNIETPFVANYVAYCNDQTIKKVAELKEKSDYVVNQAPDVDSELLFEKMIEKYKGKVVFVDFWATWCGPCRSGMKTLKPLKDELSEQPIVFLYITNPSSPENTWKAVIAETGGEHFRLTDDEWNILSERFGISGIPHYVLVDKEGKVAKNNGMNTWDVNSMKKLFEEFMTK